METEVVTAVEVVILMIIIMMKCKLCKSRDLIFFTALSLTLDWCLAHIKCSIIVVE